MAQQRFCSIANLLQIDTGESGSLPKRRTMIRSCINRVLQRHPLRRCLSTAPSLTQPTEDSTLLLTEKDSKDFFRVNELVTVENLFKARVHFGHREGMLNENMRPYVFGKRLGVIIIDLEETARRMRLALNVTADIAYRGGIILFLHTSRQSGYLVEEAAKECGEYAHCRKWRSEIFTDSRKIFGSVTRLPDLVVMFSTMVLQEMSPAVTISARMMIPTVAICDTNCNPTLITYPVPGNDDSPQSIEHYCHLFKTAVLNGKAKRKEILEKYGEEFYNKTLEVY